LSVGAPSATCVFFFNSVIIKHTICCNSNLGKQSQKRKKYWTLYTDVKLDPARVLEWSEIFGGGSEDLEFRNPETVTTVRETVARDSQMAVKLLYRDKIHQAPHEDSGNRKIWAKFVLQSRTMNSVYRGSKALLGESWRGHHPSNSFNSSRPSRHFYHLR
jgi:hypothetical protein